MSEKKIGAIDGDELLKEILKSDFRSPEDWEQLLMDHRLPIQPLERIEVAIEILEKHLENTSLNRHEHSISLAELRTLRWFLKQPRGYIDEDFGLPPTPSEGERQAQKGRSDGVLFPKSQKGGKDEADS